MQSNSDKSRTEGADVIKLMFLAKKQPWLTYDEFFTYLMHIHAPLVGRLPGARRYVINAVMPGASWTLPVCDAVEEIWFDSLATMRDAMESKAGRVMVDDRRSFATPVDGSVVVEELEVGVP